MNKATLLRSIYSVLWYAALPGVAVRLWYRGRKAPAYRQRWHERLGFIGPLKQTGGIWIHAVSLGEVIAAKPLIERLLSEHPELPLTVTTMTPTGSVQVKALFGTRVFHVYLPYDVPTAVKRFLKQLAPSVGIVMETELWFNLFTECQAQNIPVLVVNARLSARSAQRYQRFARFTRELLSKIDIVAAQNKADASRFVELGLSQNKVRVTGSIKFDMNLPARLIEQGQALRACWGSTRPVWIAASTHDGEDQQVLQAYAHILKIIPNVVLLLVPRHPERFKAVSDLCRSQGFICGLRSEGKTDLADIHVFVGDTMGEMPLFYASSDVAFVAGSFKPVGGHNVLEPAALGLPIVVGPHMFNFAQITELLISAGGLIQVADANELGVQISQLLQDKAKAKQMGAQGLAVVEQNRGALDKTYQLVQQYLPINPDKQSYESLSSKEVLSSLEE